MDRVPALALAFDADPALDPRSLFVEGLDHLRQLAGATWTDHNLHDPGITILELLAYALTDLSYRAGFPIEDRLAAPPGSALPNADHTARQFWRARQVLPCEPVTAADWRRLLIDLRGVRNAWVLPHRQTAFADPQRRELRLTGGAAPGVRPIELQGLFDVRIDFMDAVDTPARRRAVVAEVRATLARHRALGQVFVEVGEVPTTDVALCAEVEIATDADAALVAAALVFAWQTQIAPDVRNTGLDEALARAHEAAEVFEGPLLAHGFIAEAELAASELVRELRLSDLIAAAMRVAGVRAVRDLSANALDVHGDAQPRPDAWRLLLPEGTRARLAPGAGRLVLYKRHTPVLAWSFDAAPPQRLADALAALREGARRKVETERADEIALPLGRTRELARFRSVQFDFPAAYALGDAVLPEGSSPERQAQALQLAAYLLMFDQPMADHLAQLEHAQRLLSVDPDALQALARRFAAAPRPDLADEPWHQRSQLVTGLHSPVDPDEVAPLYAPGLTAEQLARDGESRAQSAQRWQASLDHLLARTGEDFAAYLALMRSAFGASDARSIGDRCRFLAEAPQLAAQRGLAFDLSADPATRWNSDNVSGLERRLARLLGIDDATRRSLALLPHETYPEIDKTPGDEFRFRIRQAADQQRVLLSSSTHYATREAARVEMRAAVERAKGAEGYQRLTASDGRFYFNIVDASGEVIARRIEYFADEAAREAAIAAAIEQLNRFVEPGEGLHLIEGILLRLVDNQDRASICSDPGCSDGADDDPFSWRLFFVLPAYAGRFTEMAFRRFAEQTIRAETPAHLCPRVCWVGPDDMAEVDRAYQDWITLPERAPRAERREKTAALREVLARAKNMYPAHALFDCVSEDAEEKPHFVLGRGALGSAPPE